MRPAPGEAWSEAAPQRFDAVRKWRRLAAGRNPPLVVLRRSSSHERNSGRYFSSYLGDEIPLCVTSCRSPLANQIRLILHTAAYWLMLELRDAIPKIHARAHCATPAHSWRCGQKLLPVRRSSNVSFTATARSIIRRSRSCVRCSCILGGHAARMAANLRPVGRSERSFLISTILLGRSSAGSTIRPSQLFLSNSVRRSWRAFRERSPIPPSSKLFGTTRSYAGEGHSSACARQPVSKLKA